MMEIRLNGEPYRVENDQCTLAELISQMALQNQRFAVEVNEEIVTRSEYPRFQLKANDRVEIVQAIGGG